MLRVRLTPKSGSDEITGIETLADGRKVLKARVRALPQEGEANAALIRLLAKTLHVPANTIEMESGATGRVKTLSLYGNAEHLAAALGQIVAGKGR